MPLWPSFDFQFLVTLLTAHLRHQLHLLSRPKLLHEVGLTVSVLWLGRLRRCGVSCMWCSMARRASTLAASLASGTRCWANTAISLLPFLYFRVTCCSMQYMQSIMQYVLEEAAPHTCECLDHASGVDCWAPPGHALSGMLEKLCV